MTAGMQRIRKLQWRCRRGMKELDLLLERFLDTEHDALSQGRWPEFESFLGEEDDRLWDWLQGSDTAACGSYAELVEQIRVGT